MAAPYVKQIKAELLWLKAVQTPAVCEMGKWFSDPAEPSTLIRPGK